MSHKSKQTQAREELGLPPLELPSVIVGRHRNAKLAERHRKELERRSGLPWIVASRRNSKGQHSLNGHYFTFVPGEEIIRKRYQSKKKTTDYEIVVRGKKVLEVRIKGKVYRGSDAEVFQSLIERSRTRSR